jgi:ADP-heptose:LPS heptosyltransferase
LSDHAALVERLRVQGGSLCLLRLSSIGDLVLCTPVIRWLHQAFPLVRLHFVTKKGMKPLLEAHQDLHQIHCWDGDESALIKELADQNFDAWIDLHNNWRTRRWYWRMVLQGQAMPRLTLSKNNLGKWWMVQTKKRPHQTVHTVQKYEKMLEPWGIKDDGKGLNLPLSPSNRTSLPETMGWDPQKPVLALALGAQHATKVLPDDLVLRLCQELPGPLLLLGGPEDRNLAERLCAQSGRLDIGHRCGEWGLQDSAWALSQCACLICPDTGLMHIASALGVKTLVVWGNTVPELGMYPWYAQPAKPALRWRSSKVHGTTYSIWPQDLGRSLQASSPEPPQGNEGGAEYFETDTACRPCSKLGRKQCPLGHFECMKTQDLTLLVERAQKALHNTLYHPSK